MAENDDTSRTPADDTEQDAFDHYWSYAKLWRTWVVGIGVGAIFILVNKDVGGSLKDRATIATLFLAAGGLQVLLAWINKISAYYRYLDKRGEISPESSKWARWWRDTNERFWIDLACDLVSLALVALGLGFLVFRVLSWQPPLE